MFSILVDVGDNVAVACGSMNSIIYRAVGQHLPVEARYLLLQGVSCSEPIVRLS